MKLQDLCAKYDIRFKKQLGQNLLLDDNINRIMVESAALCKDDFVVEVGAGLGALTSRLHPLAGRVLAIEIDQSFLPCLEDRFGGEENVALFRGDILNHSLPKLVNEHIPGGKTYKMVSNLPYYITTPILFHFWEAPIHFERLVVMVQEEVALRMVAVPGDTEYGALSVACSLFATPDIVHRVPRTCFRPVPKVDSCIVRLRNRAEPLYSEVDGAFIMRVVRTAFSQRRKTLRNALTKSGGFGAPKEAVLEALDAAGIDADRRPQTLSLDEFARLAGEIRARIPGSAA
jgi:16S rRNA (adenine1518-N6/adenine1519-N6)-dimethyltransferase